MHPRTLGRYLAIGAALACLTAPGWASQDADAARQRWLDEACQPLRTINAADDWLKLSETGYGQLRALCPEAERLCRSLVEQDRKGAATCGVFKVRALCSQVRATCAGVVEPLDTGFALQVDQDVFFPPSSDKDFTMGVQFEWHGRRTASWPPHSFLRGLDWVLQVGKAHRALGSGYELPAPGELPSLGMTAHAFHFGNTAFTPAKGDEQLCGYVGCNLERTDPLFDDRPYANLLYIEARRMSTRGRTAIVSELTLGLLGLNVGAGVQTFIHEHVTSDVRPGGWPFQISDGGELTGKYRVSVRRVLHERCTGNEAGDGTPCRLNSLGFGQAPRRFDLTGSLDLSAGYYTNASAGARIRFGRIDSTPLGSERTPIDPFVAFDARKRPSDRKLSELYVWASGGATAWACNALLQGQFRDSVVTLDFGSGPAPLERIVLDGQAGATVRVGGVSATYSITWHTPLFEGPRRRGHSWGAFYLVFGKF